MQIDRNWFVPTLFGMVVFQMISKRDTIPLALADFVAIAVFFALLWWLLGPRRAKVAGNHQIGQQPRDSIAFRLGQSLRRVFRG